MPVILVNEDSGETATVLSKPDGSFVNFIRADEDQFITAVFVNLNGTRIEIPATRQLFEDGRVGLYATGGILESSNEEAGVVQIIVKPGEVIERSVFKLDVLSLTQAIEQAGNTPPLEASVIAGMRCTVEGQPVNSPQTVRFQLNSAALGLPPGVPPENAGFALASPQTIDGVLVYELLGQMIAQNSTEEPGTRVVIEGEGQLGKQVLSLVKMTDGPTPPPPASPAANSASENTDVPTGIAASPAPSPSNLPTGAGNGNLVVVAGNVHSGIKDENGALTSLRSVPGAVVFVNDSGLKLREGNRIAPGALVGVSDRQGAFSFLAVSQSLSSSNTQFSLLATSSLFLSRLGVGSTGPYQSDLHAAIGHVYFERGTPLPGFGGEDHVKPVITVNHAPLTPAAGTKARIQVFASDDRQMSDLLAGINLAESRDNATGTITTSSIRLDGPLANLTVRASQSIRHEYDLECSGNTRVVITLTARDAESNTTIVQYPVEFGSAATSPTNPPIDPTDKIGPEVIRTTPTHNEKEHLPGSPVSITFNEPVDRNFLQHPNLAFSLTPSAGTPLMELASDSRTVSLNYYSLKPETFYTLTVMAGIQDLNGNALDQYPNNNELAESYSFSFTTQDMPSATLPGVDIGGGVVMIGQKLFALDRAGRGSLVVVDISDPSTPTMDTEVALDAYPRDIVAIPGYSYRTSLPSPDNPTPFKTSDLIAVTGGTTGGQGPWLKILDVTDPTKPVFLASTLLSRSNSATAVKLAWSPPMLGYLEIDADITSVGLIDLQLFIYAKHLQLNTMENEPVGGAPGKDLNGDGDYVDDGEVIPRLDGSRLQLGPINAGLVTAFTMADTTTQRIQDFSLGAGGKHVGLALSGGASVNGGATVPPAYVTVMSGGSRIDAASASLPLPGIPRRLTSLFGVPMQTPSGVRLSNLALVSLSAVSGQTGGSIRVIDITNPLAPSSVGDIPIPSSHGLPNSIIRRDDGMLMLAAGNDMLILDPVKLGLALPTAPNSVHPALSSMAKGAGGGIRAFAGTSSPLYAVASGNNNRIFGFGGGVDIVMHRPGTMSAPGPVVAAEAEESPYSVIVFVNEDKDDASTVETTDPPNKQQHGKGVFDNDLVTLRLRKLPSKIKQKAVGQVRLSVQHVGLQTSPLGLCSSQGFQRGFDQVSGGFSIVTEVFSAENSLLGRIRHEDVILYAEGFEPFEGAKVTLSVLDHSGAVLAEDIVKVSVVRARIDNIWSRQFPDSKSNLLPNNNGAPIGENSRHPYILMANDSNDITQVGANVRIEPENAAIMNALKLRLLPAASVQKLSGESTRHDSEFHISARDNRDIPSTFLLNSGTLRGLNPGIEEFVVGGLDYNGDGILSLEEVNIGYGVAPRQGKVASTPAGGVTRYKEFHLKVVPRSLWARQSNAYFLEVLADLVVGVANVLYFDSGTIIETIAPSVEANGVAYSLGTTHFAAFTGGVMPLGVLSPDHLGTFEVPDNVRHQRGMPLLNHNTGAFKANGFLSVPRYGYPVGGAVSARLLRSTGIFNALKRNLNQSFFITAMREAALAAPGTDFTVPFLFSRSNDTGGKLSCNFYPSTRGGEGSIAEIDLAVGLGGSSLSDMSMVVFGHKTGTPYQPGVTKVTLSKATVNVTVNELYDWELEIIPHAAVLSAGHGSYDVPNNRERGIPFRVEIPLSGDVELTQGNELFQLE